MNKLPYTGNNYRTNTNARRWFPGLFPTTWFYIRLMVIIFRSSRIARRGRFDGAAWVDSSLDVFRALEEVGVTIDVSGFENIERLQGPAVIVGNHMSMMETVLLPAMIRPVKPVTYVIKDTLLEYPVFKHVMRAVHPIAVSRTNPRQDLKTVLSEGVEKLQDDMSVIVFPQTTRAQTFDPHQMSSIAVKLAKKAGVPVIPLALKTDCWRNGTWVKDFGRIDVHTTAHFAFGEPFMITGKGDQEQDVINAFISDKLAGWQK